MKKHIITPRILLLAALLVIVLPGLVSAQEDLGALKISWSAKGKSLGAYDSIAIYAIDLRELCLSVRDMDGEMSSKCLDEETMHMIAVEIQKRFGENLQKVNPVVESETALKSVMPDSKTLFLTLKVAGDFEIEEMRPLMSLLNNWEKIKVKPARVLFECDIRPANIRKNFVTLEDAQDITFADPEKPFSTPEEINQLYSFLDEWARRVSIFLEKEK